MMEVQKFLRQHGLAELQKQFAILATDYPDRVVLNYNQIESPRFVTLVDECRALILRKGTWEVMARSFDRFYNIGEGVDPNKGLETQRIAVAYDNPNQDFIQFPVVASTIMEKLDGSLMSFYFDGNEWCVSTRKLAFAEGQTNLGRSFKEVFMDAAKKTKLLQFVKDNKKFEDFTFVFELTGPENRVVTPYSDKAITLIGARSNREEYGYRELSTTELDNMSDSLDVARPKRYSVNSYEELVTLVNAFPTMDEGVVLLIESENGSHRRIKCKNPKYVAIAHMRENGSISPKNVLKIIMLNEMHEYLKYFEEDRKYFEFVEGILAEVKRDIEGVYGAHKDIVSQKEFALAIIPKVKYSFEKGIIFSIRKGKSMEEMLQDMGPKDLSKALNMKQRFIEEFHMDVDEEET